MQPWYLDAVCSGAEWDVALVQKNGRTVAAWPWFLKKKWGFRHVSMPVLGRWMGPYLLPEYRATQHETAILEDLLKQFPPIAAFDQDFNYSALNWLPFYWQGFRQTTRYSYQLDLADIEAVWHNLAADYRNQKIPKARQAVEVKTGDDLAEFYRLHNLSYARQGLKPPFSFSFLQKLDAALAEHQSRAVFFAADLQSGAIHSAAYLIWDRQRAYLLMAGDDPARRQSGAGILLTWEMIRYTREVLGLPVFDFAGSMIKSVERVRRQFGARQQPYFRVQKEWNFPAKWAKILLR